MSSNQLGRPLSNQPRRLYQSGDGRLHASAREEGRQSCRHSAKRRVAWFITELRRRCVLLLLQTLALPRIPPWTGPNANREEGRQPGRHPAGRRVARANAKLMAMCLTTHASPDFCVNAANASQRAQRLMRALSQCQFVERRTPAVPPPRGTANRVWCATELIVIAIPAWSCL